MSAQRKVTWRQVERGEQLASGTRVSIPKPGVYGTGFAGGGHPRGYWGAYVIGPAERREGRPAWESVDVWNVREDTTGDVVRVHVDNVLCEA